MKRTRTFIYAMVALLSAAFTLQSCLDDDDYNYISIDPDTAVGIVTLKPSQSNDGSWLIQLTDSSFAQCSNIKKYPYGDKEYRAYIYFKYDSEPNLTCVLPSITITHIDTLLTKPLAPALESAEANDMAYGNDPVEIVKSWETSAEDGYMNIRLAAWKPTQSKPRAHCRRRRDAHICVPSRCTRTDWRSDWRRHGGILPRPAYRHRQGARQHQD